MVESAQFRFNQNVQDLEGKGVLDSPERVDRLSPEEQDATLKGLRSQDPLARETINQLYPFVRFYWEIPEKSRKTTGETIARFLRDIFNNEDRMDGDAESVAFAREVSKYYVYFLVFIIRDREKREAEAAASGVKKTAKKKVVSTDGDDNGVLDEDPVEEEPDDQPTGKKAKSTGTAWSGERDKHLEALLEVLWSNNQATDLGRVFDSGVPEENFLSLFWQTGELLIERGLTVVRSGSRTRELALNLLAVPSVLFHDSVGTGMASSLWNLVRQHVHASQLIVDLLSLLSNQFKHDRLARDLVQQLGETDTPLIHKNVGTLVEELAAKMPGLLLANLSLLLPYLNNKESYQMRCSIIRGLPFLIAHLQHADKTGEEAKAGTRTKILETLADWGHDVSPYVRAAVSSSWNQLVETKTLPLSHLLTALDMALEATRDKKVIVRKQALSLLENMLASNPFGPDLSVGLFVMEIERRKGELEAMLEREAEEKKEQASKMDEDEEEEPSLLGITKSPSKAEEEEEETDDAPAEEEETEEAKKKRILVEALNFLKTAVMFIDKFERSVPYFCNLLTSKTDEDVLGVVRLFATGRALQLEGSERGVRSMLKLVWHPSEKIKKVLLETMERLYIADTTGTKRIVFPPKVVANNMVDLAADATLDELTSLGEVVSEMRKSPEAALLKRTILPLVAIEELWTIILKRKENVERARVALCVLGMAASSTPQVIDEERSIAKLIPVCFIQDDQDLDLARWGFHCLSTASRSRGGKCELKGEDRAQVEMAAIGLICGGFKREDRLAWYAACQSALDLIVSLSDFPERTLYFCVENVYETCKQANFEDVPSLCALLFVAGHAALKLLIISEQLVGKIKRSSIGGKTKKATEDEEMLGASAEDELEDTLLRQVSEMDLMGEGTVFAACLDLSRRLSLWKQCPKELRQSAVLCLCKLMSCSETCCEANLPVMFTVLRDAQEEQQETRSIIVISEGDLAFRFPNALEPFTSHMYKSLRDDSIKVRKNALMVLTHLALNDMVKVRGEVAEVATRLEDEDKGVRDLARFFFVELAKRGSNPIYHLLPDILGTLSREMSGQAKFKSLAKFLLEFVDKDKQCEQLADKLCHRVMATLGGAGDFNPQINAQDLSIARDLCFCLEQLKMSDVLLRRLNDDTDLFKCIRPVLGDSPCYSSLAKLVQKSSPKSQEMKRVLEELQQKMSKLHESQAADMAVYDKANSKKASKASDKAVGDILQSVQERMADENKIEPNKKPRAPRAAPKKKKVQEEEEDDENEVLAGASTKTRRGRA